MKEYETPALHATPSLAAPVLASHVVMVPRILTRFVSICDAHRNFASAYPGIDMQKMWRMRMVK
jgi:hypothetical protein